MKNRYLFHPEIVLWQKGKPGAVGEAVSRLTSATEPDVKPFGTASPVRAGISLHAQRSS
jgi:hypothetical protein